MVNVEDLGMQTLNVPRLQREIVWQFIATNIDRLRPIGFDGHTIYCRAEDANEIGDLINQ